MFNPYTEYKRTQIETAEAGKLVLMLYDGSLRCLHKAREGLKKKDFAQVSENLGRAQEIVGELMASLDMEQGEIARNLFHLYEYMHLRLVQANIKKTEEPLGEVAALLTDLRESWEQVYWKSRNDMRTVAGDAL